MGLPFGGSDCFQKGDVQKEQTETNILERNVIVEVNFIIQGPSSLPLKALKEEGPLPAAQRGCSKLQCACHALIARLTQSIGNQFLQPEPQVSENKYPVYLLAQMHLINRHVFLLKKPRRFLGSTELNKTTSKNTVVQERARFFQSSAPLGGTTPVWGVKVFKSSERAGSDLQ